MPSNRRTRSSTVGSVGLELHRARVKALRGLYSGRAFATKKPSASTIRAARELHNELFGRFVKERMKGTDGKKRTISHYEPGLMSWKARDPKVRDEMYAVQKPPQRLLERFQKAVGQDKIHPRLRVIVQKVVDLPDYTVPLRPSAYVASTGTVVNILYNQITTVVQPDGEYIASEDEEENFEGFRELYAQAEEVAESIIREVEGRCPKRRRRMFPCEVLCGQPLFQLMYGPNVYRMTGSSVDELIAKHAKNTEKYNSRENEKNNYDSWFTGIFITIPFSLSKDGLKAAKKLNDDLRRDQTQKRRDRLQSKSRRNREER